MAITKEMPIMDCVVKFPETIDIFSEFGMGCLGCAAANFESIEDGAVAHNMNLDALILALNAAVA
ncbi:MAG: DUF1858 domain-containing protein [Eubacteriaceae bacterium]|jgi:hybrid cluster-associated redox disulfide protein|nr:DUF1858 domain-containing protein [Eubacteriaceae bacterium]